MEAAASSIRRFDVTAVLLDDAVRDREAEAGALYPAADVGLEEGIADIRRDAATVVFDGDAEIELDDIAVDAQAATTHIWRRGKVQQLDGGRRMASLLDCGR